MAKKFKVVDKRVLHIVDSYVVDGYDWRLFYENMAEVFQELRSAK